MSPKLQANNDFSCFGKLFTSILKARLNKLLDAYTILGENQTGFHAGYSTIGHIFVLHALTEIAKTQKRNCSVRLLI